MSVVHGPSRFPDPLDAGPEGIIAVGGDLSVETLLDAYSHGIFPWPQEGLPLLWFSPKERGIIDLARPLVAPKRFLRDFKRDLRSSSNSEGLTFSVNTRFSEVIRLCAAAPRPGQDGTWLMPEMVEAYEQLHREGYAHSFEVFENAELVGGLYGVFIRGVFSGESMFHLRANRSKAALWVAMNTLKRANVELFDVQMVTSVVAQFGGHLLDRPHYIERLKFEQNKWDRLGADERMRTWKIELGEGSIEVERHE